MYLERLIASLAGSSKISSTSTSSSIALLATASLAYKRHFPAIDWLTSYSLYDDKLSEWYKNNVSENWMAYRGRALKILQEEANLDEIVRLVGVDALSPKDRMIMETAKSIREDYLHQDAFHEVDTYASLTKQCTMLKTILEAHDLANKAIEEDVEVDDILELPAREAVPRLCLCLLPKLYHA